MQLVHNSVISSMQNVIETSVQNAEQLHVVNNVAKKSCMLPVVKGLLDTIINVSVMIESNIQ